MKLFFEIIVDRTTVAISKALEEQTKNREERMKAMEENKKNLLNQLKSEGDQYESDLNAKYKELQDTFIDITRYKKSTDELKNIREVKHADMYAKYDVEKEKQDLIDAGKDAILDVPNYFKKQAKVSDAAEKVNKEKNEYEQAVKAANAETDQLLIDRVKSDYKQCFEEKTNYIIVGSHDYWVEGSKIYKDLLMKIVTGSDLAQEEKDDLNIYITNYELSDQ